STDECMVSGASGNAASEESCSGTPGPNSEHGHVAYNDVRPTCGTRRDWYKRSADDPRSTTLLNRYIPTQTEAPNTQRPGNGRRMGQLKGEDNQSRKCKYLQNNKTNQIRRKGEKPAETKCGGASEDKYKRNPGKSTKEQVA